MTIHNLKILPNHFYSLKNGYKTFELRKFDRNYQVNDILILNEWNPKEKYSGNFVCVKVKYILRNGKKFGLKKGYGIMSIELL